MRPVWQGIICSALPLPSPCAAPAHMSLATSPRVESEHTTYSMGSTLHFGPALHAGSGTAQSTLQTGSVTINWPTGPDDLNTLI